MSESGIKIILWLVGRILAPQSPWSATVLQKIISGFFPKFWQQVMGDLLLSREVTYWTCQAPVKFTAQIEM